MCFVQRLSLMRKINDEDDGNGFVYFRLFYTGNIRHKEEEEEELNLVLRIVF